MEDTKSLLMMVLHKIFQNQPKTIENTFQLIHSFNNGKIDKKNYEKTLKTICDLMNDELPSPILVYVLTLVDMPQDVDSQSPLIEKMRKTHDFLPDMNVRPHLLDFLNNMKPSHKIANKIDPQEKKDSNFTIKSLNSNDTVQNINKPTKILQPPCSISTTSSAKPTNNRVTKRNTRKLLSKITVQNPKKLLDICACYVAQKENILKAMYKRKQSRAWNLINKNIFSGSRLEQCYNVVKDLNKKTKWLREIESNNISAEILMDEYKNSDIFLKENHVYEDLKRDPFKLSPECEEAIELLVKD